MIIQKHYNLNLTANKMNKYIYIVLKNSNFRRMKILIEIKEYIILMRKIIIFK